MMMMNDDDDDDDGKLLSFSRPGTCRVRLSSRVLYCVYSRSHSHASTVTKLAMPSVSRHKLTSSHPPRRATRHASRHASSVMGPFVYDLP